MISVFGLPLMTLRSPKSRVVSPGTAMHKNTERPRLNKRKASHSPWFPKAGTAVKKAARKTRTAKNIEFLTGPISVAPVKIP